MFGQTTGTPRFGRPRALRRPVPAVSRGEAADRLINGTLLPVIAAASTLVAPSGRFSPRRHLGAGRPMACPGVITVPPSDPVASS